MLGLGVYGMFCDLRGRIAEEHARTATSFMTNVGKRVGAAVCERGGRVCTLSCSWLVFPCESTIIDLELIVWWSPGVNTVRPRVRFVRSMPSCAPQSTVSVCLRRADARRLCLPAAGTRPVPAAPPEPNRRRYPDVDWCPGNKRRLKLKLPRIPIPDIMYTSFSFFFFFFAYSVTTNPRSIDRSLD